MTRDKELQSWNGPSWIIPDGYTTGWSTRDLIHANHSWR